MTKSRREWRADFLNDDRPFSTSSGLSGLGQRLWEEVDEHIAWIERNHDVPRLRPDGYRRVNLKIFPYYISYVVRDPVIWILAIAHSHSRPEYWIDRPNAIG